MITIAIPKGYLFKESAKLFKKIGIDIDFAFERQLSFFDKQKQFRFLKIRPFDVPVYVEHGAADLGIVGRDILNESQEDVAELLDLKNGFCKLVVAAPIKAKLSANSLFNNMRVGTKYVNSARAYFRKQDLKVEIIKLYGSVELAPQFGLADVIVDLVATGKTLKENGLEIVDTVFKSSARLIANPVKLRTNYQKLISLVKSLQNIIK